MTVDQAGLPGRVVPVPVIEARYSGLRAVKGGLVWRRSQVTGVLGEGGADLDDDAPRPALERFDLRKREVTEIAREVDWFDVSGDGTRLVVHDDDELQVVPVGKRDDPAETVTVDKSRARFQADPAALWRHAYAEAGRIMRRKFSGPRTCPAWTGTARPSSTGRCWTRSAATATSPSALGSCSARPWHVRHSYGRSRARRPSTRRSGSWARNLVRDAAGRWLVDRVLPGESSDPRARSPLAAPAWGSIRATSWWPWTGSRSTRYAARGRCWPGPRASRPSPPSSRRHLLPGGPNPPTPLGNPPRGDRAAAR